MKSTFVIFQEFQPVQLYELVNQLIRTSAIAALRSRSLIINEVPPEVMVVMDKNMISSIIGELLHAMLKQAKDTSIRISAKVCNNVVLVQVNDTNGRINHGIYYGVQHAQPMVEKIGGFLGITSYRNGASTVTFSFPEIQEMAGVDGDRPANYPRRALDPTPCLYR